MTPVHPPTPGRRLRAALSWLHLWVGLSVGTLFALFHSSSVSVADGAVVIRHRVLGMGTTRRFAAGEIIDVEGVGHLVIWRGRAARLRCCVASGPRRWVEG